MAEPYVVNGDRTGHYDLFRIYMAGASLEVPDERHWRNHLAANYRQYDGVDFLNPLENHDSSMDGELTEEEYSHFVKANFGMIDEADAVFVHWDNDLDDRMELKNLGREVGYSKAVGTPVYVHNATDGEVLERLSEDVEAVFDTEGATMNAILWR